MAASPAELTEETSNLPKEKNKGGRPFFNRTPELDAYIFDQLSIGRSLRSICKEEDLPDINTVLSWVREDELFRQSYACARENQAEVLADEIVEIADGVRGEIESAVVNAAKLAVETRMRFAAVVAPKKYGNNNGKNEVHLTNNIQNNLIYTEPVLVNLQERRKAQLEDVK